MTGCALWYRNYGTLRYDLYGSEEEAAASAVYMMDTGNCAVTGVSFPDGRAVKREDWQAYADAEERIFAAEAAAPPYEPPPSKTISSPFGEARVPPDAPAWLGEVRP